MARAAKPSKKTDKTRTDEAHEKSVAAFHQRLDAEQKLKEKVREEERACFEETARILGHKPPSAEQAKATARRVEMISRIAKLGEQAGFIGEAFADDYGETLRRRFAGSQIMSGDSPWGERPYDLASNSPWSSYTSTVFQPPYRFKREYPDSPTDDRDWRGADRLSGKVFAKSSSIGLESRHRSLGASVGVSFSLPANRFEGPIPRVSGRSLGGPPYRKSRARIIASIAGTKRWMFHAESLRVACSGQLLFSPIFVRPIYENAQLDPFFSPSLSPTNGSATRWNSTDFPRDVSLSDPYVWSVYAMNTHWPAATALPAIAMSKWFTVDNYHTYDIHVGVLVETQGYWRIGGSGGGGSGYYPDDVYSLAVAEMEAVIESITIEITGFDNRVAW